LSSIQLSTGRRLHRTGTNGYPWGWYTNPVRVVSVTPYLREATAHSAGDLFYFNLLVYLAERFDVEVVAPDLPKNREAVAGAAVPWSVTLAQPLQPRTPRVWQELWMQYRGSQVPDVTNVNLANADVIEFQWSPAAALAPGIRRRYPSAFVSAWFHDRYSSTLAWSRTRGRSTSRRIYDSMAKISTRLQEYHVAAACDLMVAFKPEDLAYVRFLPGRKRRPGVMVSSPWLESPISRYGPTDQSILFVAAFGRWENQEGARWLLDEVWPRVQCRAPHARLVLAGAGPPPWLLERRSASVDVTGALETLSPLYMRATAVVAPIFAGGGLRFKVAQAMVHGVPLVATTVAMEGYGDVPRALVAGVIDDPVAFAGAILSILEEPGAYETRAQQLQEWAMTKWSFASSVEEVAELYSRGLRQRRSVHEGPA